MTGRARLFLLLALAAGLPGALAAQGRSPTTAQLVSTDTLAAWIARGAPVRLLDTRLDVWTYLKGHLPGAQYLNIETLRASQGGIPVQPLDTQWYRDLFRRLGLDPSVPVVVYSAGETLNIDATFAAWILASMGHPKVYLLDGGYSKWSYESREIARKYPRVSVAGRWWTGQNFRPGIATLADVQRGMRGGVLLVDARPRDQYVGEAGSQMRLGHIPGAVNHWWQNDLTTGDFGRVFLPVDSLRAQYAREGITPDRDLILYCNSATEASHVFFALKYLLKYPRVRIYAGSWTEWAEREDLPLERGAGPRNTPPLRVAPAPAGP
jgi:thiosulfate/3-mercaptopyruvate sulfurtransferase